MPKPEISSQLIEFPGERQVPDPVAQGIVASKEPVYSHINDEEIPEELEEKFHKEMDEDSKEAFNKGLHEKLGESTPKVESTFKSPDPNWASYQKRYDERKPVKDLMGSYGGSTTSVIEPQTVSRQIHQDTK